MQTLSVQEARLGYPVELRAVVTYVDTGPGELFVEDETGGIFVFIKESKTNAPLHTGQLVAVKGVSTPADFTPSVTRAEIRVLGQGKLPRPRRLHFDQLLANREDSHWGEMEGVVRAGQIKGERLFLNVATQGGAFLGVMKDYPPDWEARLVDAKVIVRGVVAAIFNERRQSIGVRMFIPGLEHIQILGRPPADPLALPLSPLVSVGQFRSQSDLERRIHVRASVIGIEPGTALYISDGDGSLAVLAHPPCPVRVGELIDVAGFPGAVDGRPSLLDAVCRRAGQGPRLQPVKISPQDVLPPIIQTALSGTAIQAGMRFDLKLVQIEAILLRTSDGPDGSTLLLHTGGDQFTATRPGQNVSAGVTVGSLLRLTGVCLIGYDRYHRAQSFRLLLRQPADVVVVARPPWLSLRLALWGLAVMVVFLAACLAWVSVLRRQVARRTMELRRANEGLQLLSAQDALTGLANRRKFDETLETEFRSARRMSRVLSLVMVDIDHFKALNDKCGHQRGDECLKEVARLLAGVVKRDTDLVCRYGGEEFAIILPGTSAEGALLLAECVRTTIEERTISHPSSPFNGHLSVSAGVATWQPGDDAKPAGLIALADRALYRAKTLGRNRTIFLDDNSDPFGSPVAVRPGAIAL